MAIPWYTPPAVPPEQTAPAPPPATGTPPQWGQWNQNSWIGQLLQLFAQRNPNLRQWWTTSQQQWQQNRPPRVRSGWAPQASSAPTATPVVPTAKPFDFVLGDGRPVQMGEPRDVGPWEDAIRNLAKQRGGY